MSTSTESDSGEGGRLPEAKASLAAQSSLRFSLLWAERISAFVNVAHMSSDHPLQVLQGVVGAGNPDPVEAGSARGMVIPVGKMGV